jgi:plastocyanin
VMDTDEKFSYTFTKAGTYSYYCSVHPKMTGQVVVK